MRKVVCIDPGHGGHDSGALGPAGTREKDLALKLAHLVREQVDRTVRVVMTRQNDEYLELGERAHIANAAQADLFLSIHFNAANGRAHGFEAFTSPGQTAADPVAARLLNAWAARFPGRVPRFGMGDGDEDKEASFAVLRRTSMPAVLMECAFIDHAPSEQWLLMPETLEAMADVLAGWILAELGHEERNPRMHHLEEIRRQVDQLEALG